MWYNNTLAHDCPTATFSCLQILYIIDGYNCSEAVVNNRNITVIPFRKEQAEVSIASEYVI